MIKDTLNVNIGNSTLDGEIIVPSPILTSTKQEENCELTYSPNFVIKLTDSERTIAVSDIVNTEFTIGSYNYTAQMRAINRNSNTITLQYIDGLTVEEGGGDEPEPEPDPVLSQSINNILGSNYDVINDMSDEDALAAANNILYGDEEPPK